MNRMFILVSTLFLVFLALASLTSCKKADPSILKIFVRSSSNELMEGAEVIVIGDLQSNPATHAYVDTLITNSSGFAEFNMEKYFEGADNNTATGYFDILAKKNTKSGNGYVRCRTHMTTVETVFLMN